MKNIDILNLANAGVLEITTNDLDAAHAYKVIKFKAGVKKAYDAVQESDTELLKEVGIKDPAAFDKERRELMESKKNPSRLEELNKQYDRLVELRKKLYDEEVELDCKTMPFEQFRILQKENSGQKGNPLGAFDYLLEGVLWAAPEEKE